MFELGYIFDLHVTVLNIKGNLKNTKNVQKKADVGG